MALMANQHDRIWKGGGDTTASSETIHTMTIIILSLTLAYLKMTFMYKKLTMGCSFCAPQAYIVYLLNSCGLSCCPWVAGSKMTYCSLGSDISYNSRFPISPSCCLFQILLPSPLSQLCSSLQPRGNMKLFVQCLD